MVRFGSGPAGAINSSAILGLTLQAEMPGVLKKTYISEGSVRGAVSALGIDERYSVSWDVAVSAVYRALFGYNFEHGDIDPYHGILDDQEAEELVIQHKRNAVEKGTRGLLARDSSKMRMDGLTGIVAQGKAPWSEGEREFVSRLAGTMEVGDIRKSVNSKYHNGKNVRSHSSIEHAVRRALRGN